MTEEFKNRSLDERAPGEPIIPKWNYTNHLRRLTSILAPTPITQDVIERVRAPFFYIQKEFVESTINASSRGLLPDSLTSTALSGFGLCMSIGFRFFPGHSYIMHFYYRVQWISCLFCVTI